MVAILNMALQQKSKIIELGANLAVPWAIQQVTVKCETRRAACGKNRRVRGFPLEWPGERNWSLGGCFVGKNWMIIRLRSSFPSQKKKRPHTKPARESPAPKLPSAIPMISAFDGRPIASLKELLGTVDDVGSVLEPVDIVLGAIKEAVDWFVVGAVDAIDVIASDVEFIFPRFDP